MPARPYNLLIATGQSPQVVTETVFELHRAEDLQPASVHVVTTRVGRAYGRAQLLGEPQADPARGTAIQGVEARWPTFCEEILGRSPENGEAPVNLSFQVPEAGAEGLDDIHQRGDDTRFANLCYELVERLTREDQFPLIGSIAGGRKTMSAHLMTAFSVYGRPDDRLTHVLLSDPSLEGDLSFFYPEPGSPRYARLLNLVDVRFPRLHTLLEKDLIDGLPGDRQDLEGILDALDPHIASARPVETVTLQLRDGEARLVFEGTGEQLGTCTLTPKQAATLLVFADRRAARGGSVPSTDLTYEDPDAPLGKQREAVRFLCSSGEEEALSPWTDTGSVSKDISDLNDTLRTVPVASRLLCIEGLSRSPRRYDWPGESPPLEVATRYPGEDWPFEHLPALKRLE